MIVRADILKTDRSILVPAHCILDKKGKQVPSRFPSKIKSQNTGKTLIEHIKHHERRAAWKVYIDERRDIVAGYYKAYNIEAPRDRISLHPRYEHLRETKTRIQWFMLAPDMELITKIISMDLAMLSGQWTRPSILNPFPSKSPKWEEFNHLVEKHLPRFDSISL